jgi:4-amino-4-deoxy-L-arabinose transferase-like glycosyltransferase
MTTLTLPPPISDLDRPARSVAVPPDDLARGPSRRRTAQPRWVNPALVGLLAATAVLYLWGLGASGWANSFYSAAVQAGAHSWKAFFFGSSDAANFITVDKPPAALWVMELSARVFGVNAWSILVPQALEGVAAVGVLYATVKRWFGHVAGLLAGAVLALTPVATLMFRFNNPDALLVLLLTGAAYCTVRALEDGRTRWLALAGTLVGFGFITKMLQAFLVVPAFALAYLIAGPPKLGRRAAQLAVAGAALVVSSFWWVVAVMAIPAADRPYIGGSTNNSLWNLIFGYNGFGRLTGNETGSVGGGGTTGSRWGATGLLRLFNSDFGADISWLLPAALILLAAGLALTWRARRTDRTRAALIVWGGWLVVTGVAISLGQGIIHPYYTVALAPAVGALVGVGAVTLWEKRRHVAARAVLGTALAATAVWSYLLLNRVPAWHPMLRDGVLLGGLIVAVLLVTWSHLRGRIGAIVAAAAILVALAGPASYSLATAATTHSGAIPTAGPSGAGGGLGGGPGGGGPGGGAGGGLGRRGGTRPAGTAIALPAGAVSSRATASAGFGPGGAGQGGAGRGGQGGIGGLLNGSTSNATLTAALKANASHYTWVAAAIGSNEAAGYQLASGKPVMAIGGFNGTDPAPSLAEFERYVQEGRIHYFISGGGNGGGPGGSGTTTSVSSQISSWVESHYTATTIGGVTVYNLSPATTS